MEKTLVLIKPNALQRGLVGDIVTRFERKGRERNAKRAKRRVRNGAR